MTTYTYTKSPVSLDRLTLEVRASAITVALDHLQLDGTDQLSLVFKAELPTADKDVLDALVAAHTGEPLPPEHASVGLEVPKNAEGKPIFVRSMTETNWHYSPHALDFYTSTFGSLFNRDESGGTIADSVDAGDGVMKFFDAYNDELLMDAYESPEEFQVRLTASCTKTIIDFEKTTPFDIIGCTLYIEATPAQTAYMWVTVAPDLPKEWGGNVSLMGRGMNLKMMGRPMYPHMFFAESVARLNYHPTYHSGKIRITVKHVAGAVIGIQNLFIMYEA